MFHSEARVLVLKKAGAHPGFSESGGVAVVNVVN